MREAAEMMALSPRQVRRLRPAYRHEGAAGLGAREPGATAAQRG